MPHDNHMNMSDVRPAASDVEAALRSLAPALGNVDPLAAAYAAGRTGRRRELFAWRAAAVVALGIGTVGWLNPANRGGGGDVVVHRDGPTTPVLASTPMSVTPPVAGAQSVLVMQRALTEGGLQALPAVPAPSILNLRNKDLF